MTEAEKADLAVCIEMLQNVHKELRELNGYSALHLAEADVKAVVFVLERIVNKETE